MLPLGEELLVTSHISSGVCFALTELLSRSSCVTSFGACFNYCRQEHAVLRVRTRISASTQGVKSRDVILVKGDFSPTWSESGIGTDEDCSERRHGACLLPLALSWAERRGGSTPGGCGSRTLGAS